MIDWLLLLRLFLAFAKIGLFTIGGGYAMIPLISQEVSSVNGWMTAQEVSDVVAISQITPGPIAINAATFAGMKTAGFLGACSATLGVATPAVVICLLLARFFIDFLKKPAVRGVLYGVRPVVVGLIAYAAFQAGQSSLILVGQPFPALVDWPMLALAAGVLFLLIKTKVDSVLLILLCAAAGIALHLIGI